MNAEHKQEYKYAASKTLNGEILANIGKRADQQADNDVRLAGRADDRGHDDGGGVDQNADNKNNQCGYGNS